MRPACTRREAGIRRCSATATARICGVTYKGFSIDGFYTKENAAVNSAFFNNPFYTTNTYTTCAGGALGSGNCENELLGTITNNEAWDIMAKYTFDAPSFFGYGSFKDEPCGSLKDPCTPTGKMTLFGGYQYVTMSNPDHAQSYYNGYDTIGGYQLFTLQNLYKGGSADDVAYQTARVLETAWGGARYETGPWAFTAAYYWWHQDAYIYYNGKTCAAQTQANVVNYKSVAGGATFVGNAIAPNCSGDYNQVSFLIDYTFTKHFDVYAGVSLSDIGGGLASGFLKDSDVAVASGLRIKF